MADAYSFRRLLERHDLTIDELVETADALVRQLTPKQTRYKVTDRPDARTIRYYIQQQLLPKPAGYDGGRARYGGSHLLRLLLIKRLQAEHHTLAHIGRILDGASDDDVIAALTAGSDTSDTNSPARGEVSDVSDTSDTSDIDALMRDPAKRRQLADTLEAIAHWLRKA